MKSIYLRNFVATATMVSVCFLIIACSFILIGRNYIISEYRSDMEASAREVSRAASAIAGSDDLNSFALSMLLSSISNSTGNHIFITDTDGRVINCSDRAPVCRHLDQRLSAEHMSLLESAGYINQITQLQPIYADNRYVMALPVSAQHSDEDMGYVFVTNNVDNILGAWSAFLSLAALSFALIGEQVESGHKQQGKYGGGGKTADNYQ